MSLPRHLLPALLACLLALAVSVSQGAAPQVENERYTYFACGDLTPSATPVPHAPGLMLMGGSDSVDAAFKWFVSRIPGGKVVVLRAYGDDDYNDYFYKDIGGLRSVETFVFHSQDASYDPFVIEKVKAADGIFFAGGDQSFYVRYWKGTPLNTAFDAHVRAGKPIGGTSAGLAILGEILYGCMDSESLTSAVALADPYTPGVTLVSDFLHFDLLKGVITDSHFSKRNRLGRLIVFLARIQETRSGFIGLGVDEKTALCIDGNGEGRVFTQEAGNVWVVRLPESVALSQGHPVDLHAIRIEVLGPESRIDLKTQRTTAPVRQLQGDITQGTLVLTPSAEQHVGALTP